MLTSSYTAENKSDATSRTEWQIFLLKYMCNHITHLIPVVSWEVKSACYAMKCLMFLWNFGLVLMRIFNNELTKLFLISGIWYWIQQWIWYLRLRMITDLKSLFETFYLTNNFDKSLRTGDLFNVAEVIAYTDI